MELASHCDKCGDPLYTEQEILGQVMKLPIMCKCKKAELEKDNERIRHQELNNRLKALKKNSLMDDKFSVCTFDNWELDNTNKKSYSLGVRYCEKWDDIKKENIGLILHGEPGTGKTFLSFCIANYLLNRYVPVIAISTIGILSRIKETYNNHGTEAEAEIIRTIQNADLLILDDLGAENETSWSRSMIYEIIDFRYRNKKPLIITTNLSMDALKEKLTGDDGVARTYDRIIEMCQPIEVKGTNKRLKKASEKTQILKGLLSEGEGIT